MHNLLPFVQFEKRENNHGGVTILVKLQASLRPATLLKVLLLYGCFSSFLNSANGTKLCKASLHTQHTRDSMSWVFVFGHSVIVIPFSKGLTIIDNFNKQNYLKITHQVYLANALSADCHKQIDFLLSLT